MSKVRRLGLGLDGLLGPTASVPNPITKEDAPAEKEIEIGSVHPNPFQPRSLFDDDETKSLAESIRTSGILQPVLVRRVNGHFELVAGERRLRAARIAGCARVPVVVRDIDDRRMLELALVENLQRKDLNPIEKASAFRKLMQMNSWTQEEVARAVGLSRPSVANFIRLLELPPEIQEAVSRGTISMGHARALLATTNRVLQMKLLQRILREELSVRALEMILSGAKPQGTSLQKSSDKDPYLEDLERKFTDFFGTRVRMEKKKRGGRISIEWYSDNQFKGILERLNLA